MKKILAFVAIIAVLSISTVAFARSYGAQFVQGTLFGYTDKNKSEVYKISDTSTGATCYILYFGTSGADMECVK